MDIQQLKLLAGRIRGLLEQSEISITHNQALDTAASLAGVRNWPEVQAFVAHVTATDLDLAATSRLGYRLKKRHGLELDAQQLLDALRPPSESVQPEGLQIWPSGPGAGVYVTTEADCISTLLDAYSDATDGALVYTEMSGADGHNCIDLGEYGLWSSGIDHVPSGTLFIVGPIELNQQAWGRSADRLEMACLHAVNSGHRIAVLVETETPKTLFHDLQLMVRGKQPEDDDLFEQIKGEITQEGALVQLASFAPVTLAPPSSMTNARADAIPAPAREQLQQVLSHRHSGLVMVGSSEVQEHWAIDLVEAVLAMTNFAGPAARIRPRRRSTPAKDWQVPESIRALPFLPSVESAYSLGYRRMIVTPGYTPAELFSAYGNEVLFIAGDYGGSVEEIFMNVVRTGGKDSETHALRHLIAVLGVTALRTSRRQADLMDLYLHDGWQGRAKGDRFSQLLDKLREGRTIRSEDQLSAMLDAGEIAASTVKKALPRERWSSELLAARSKKGAAAAQ
jgi:hypothetical protein